MENKTTATSHKHYMPIAHHEI